jgi:hypothetical protein
LALRGFLAGNQPKTFAEALRVEPGLVFRPDIWLPLDRIGTEFDEKVESMMLGSSRASILGMLASLILASCSSASLLSSLPDTKYSLERTRLNTGLFYFRPRKNLQGSENSDAVFLTANARKVNKHQQQTGPWWRFGAGQGSRNSRKGFWTEESEQVRCRNVW